MEEKHEVRERILVIGHKNPDTDSICSAIAYAELKRRTAGGEYVACRAGELSGETAWVLRRFGLAAPELCEDVSPQVGDVEIRRTPGVSGEITVKEAWGIMRDRDISTLPVTGEDGRLQGIISLRDLAVAHMDNLDTKTLGRAGTPYGNIAQTLCGQVVCGDPRDTMDRGRILVGAGNPEAISAATEEGDLVLVSNRVISQTAAIESGAACVVVCLSAEIRPEVMELARSRGCTLISTPFDTYRAAYFINQSVPLRHYLVSQNLLQFQLSTPLEDAVRVMGRTRYVYFPVLDEEGLYYGVISRRNLLNRRPRKLILVDHNEKAQCVAGWEEAEIQEIIDHHRVGGLQTMGPIFFRNQPVGSTATIVWQMYGERGLDPSPAVAGALCCAVLSDTLMLRSPTCTPLDRRCVQELAALAGEDPEKLGEAMFEAGEDLTGRNGEEILYQDFKVFTAGEASLGIGQSSFLSPAARRRARDLVEPLLPGCLPSNGVALAYYLLTDIRAGGSDVLWAGPGGDALVRDAFGLPEDGPLYLPGVVSRKKQFVPALMEALRRRERETR